MRSGKPTPPPVETDANTPGTRGFSEAPQAKFTAHGLPILPALRQSGPRPPMSGESLTATLTALLTKPEERSDKAKEVLARQPLMAEHPIVSGNLPMFMPHRPERPEKSQGGVPFKIDRKSVV